MTSKYDPIKISKKSCQITAEKKTFEHVFFLILLNPIVNAQQHCRYNLLYPFPNAIDCVPICIVNDTPRSAPHQLIL